MPAPSCFSKSKELKRKVEGKTATPTSAGTADDKSYELLDCDLRKVKAKLRKESTQLRSIEEGSLRLFVTRSQTTV